MHSIIVLSFTKDLKLVIQTLRGEEFKESYRIIDRVVKGIQAYSVGEEWTGLMVYYLGYALLVQTHSVEGGRHF